MEPKSSRDERVLLDDALQLPDPPTPVVLVEVVNNLTYL